VKDFGDMLVEAITLSALVPDPSEEVFNSGTGLSVTISEVISLLLETFPIVQSQSWPPKAGRSGDF
jgi:nucleoside-diphosphate-sugar epimerase